MKGCSVAQIEGCSSQAVRVVVVILSVVVSIVFIDVVVVGFMFVHVIVVVTCCELSSYPVVLALFGELQRAMEVPGRRYLGTWAATPGNSELQGIASWAKLLGAVLGHLGLGTWVPGRVPGPRRRHREIANCKLLGAGLSYWELWVPGPRYLGTWATTPGNSDLQR